MSLAKDIKYAWELHLADPGGFSYLADKGTVHIVFTNRICYISNDMHVRIMNEQFFSPELSKTMSLFTVRRSDKLPVHQKNLTDALPSIRRHHLG